MRNWDLEVARRLDRALMPVRKRPLRERVNWRENDFAITFLALWCVGFVSMLIYMGLHGWQ